MRMKSTILLTALLLIFPLTLLGGAKECVPGKPTARSHTWDFSAEALQLFDDISLEAAEVKRQAALLETFARVQGQPSWKSHTDELNRIRANTNEIGEALCRLHTIHRVADSWQKDLIHRLTPDVIVLAGETEKAVEYANNNAKNLAQPYYARTIGNIYERASSLHQAAKNILEDPQRNRLSTSAPETRMLAGNFCGF